MNTTARDLQTIFEVGSLGGLSDGQLLDRYVSGRETAVFETIIHRHGSMVWGVCRRVLRDHHDADDAFQATFLVFARKASSVKAREKIGHWLYGVAYQTAVKAKAMKAKRRGREGRMLAIPEPEAPRDEPADDRLAQLDRELSLLPEKYRVPIILCELERKTHKEAAEQLGWPLGTVSGRLWRGKELLARRLSRGDVSFSVGPLTVLMARDAASATLPTRLVGPAAEAASLLSSCKAATAGMVSAKVVSLAYEVSKAMLIGKIKAVAAVLLVVGVMATALAYRTSAAQDDKSTHPVELVENTQKQEPEKEGFTAWGEEVGGLQAGLGYRPGERRAYGHGETATLVVRVRNVSKEAVKFHYLEQFFIEKPPTVTDGEGKPVGLLGVTRLGIHVPVEVNLAPGKEIELYAWKPQLKSASHKDDEKFNFSTLYGTGKFHVQYEQVIGNSSSGFLQKPDRDLSKLATGKLELEIKSDLLERKRASTAPQVPVRAADGLASFSTTIADFRSLTPEGRKALVKNAFEHRLRLAKNLRYEASMRGRNYKYHDGEIGEVINELNGRDYRYRRLADSYRIASDKGGVDVAKPNEFAESAFDSSTGVVTTTVRFGGTPRTFARIDAKHGYDVKEDRYSYWLDGEAEKDDQGDFLIRGVVEQIDRSKLEIPADQDKVRLTFPWQPPWSREPLGTRSMVLDPRKGFLPIEGSARLELKQSDGPAIWRAEDFVVKTSKLVRDVWMPVELREEIRSSSTGPEHLTVWETKVTDIEAGSVVSDDLIIELPEGAEVVDALQGISFVVGPGGDRSKFRPLYNAKDRQRASEVLIGNRAPEFPKGATWLNGAPLTWGSLEGKVVVLDFWAEWCGPCRAELLQLSRLYESRAANGLTIIGVHPPGSDPRSIQKVIDEFHIAYPILVDIEPRQGVRAWGDFFGRFAVQAIPAAVAVDGKGTVVYIGNLREAIIEANKLVEKRRD